MRGRLRRERRNEGKIGGRSGLRWIWYR
jgi:hypothetical protein